MLVSLVASQFEKSVPYLLTAHYINLAGKPFLCQVADFYIDHPKMYFPDIEIIHHFV